MYYIIMTNNTISIANIYMYDLVYRYSMYDT